MRFFLASLVMVTVGGIPTKKESLEKSLLQMFKAYRGSSDSESGSTDQRMLPRNIIDEIHKHDQSNLGVYHDGPGGHHHDDDGHVHLQQQRDQDHEHDSGTFSLYHDGPGGHHHDDDGHLHLHDDDGHLHPHDDDGHIHQQPQRDQDHEHDTVTFSWYHDGPGGHHHDDDGHLHPRAQQAGGYKQQRSVSKESVSSSKNEEGNIERESLRDITLTMSKLLFHLSQF